MHTQIPETIYSWLANPAPGLLLLVPVLAFLEAAALIGIFVSGLLLLSASTLLYSTGAADISAIIGLAFLGAMAGDASGFLVGRFFGDRFWTLPVMQRFQDRRERVGAVMTKSAPWAIFVGRLTPAIRSITPILVGMTSMRTARFIVFDMAACALWAAGLYVLVKGIAGFQAAG